MSQSKILKDLRLEVSKLMGSLSVREIILNQKLIQELEVVLRELSKVRDYGG